MKDYTGHIALAFAFIGFAAGAILGVGSPKAPPQPTPSTAWEAVAYVPQRGKLNAPMQRHVLDYGLSAEDCAYLLADGYQNAPPPAGAILTCEAR